MPSNHEARASSRKTPAQAFRRLLELPGTHQGPICHDALSAKLVERAGFPFTFMGGFAVSSTRLGLPDVGLISYGEMLDQGFLITQAVSIPVIGDGDTGYGSPMNVKRTVKGFIKAGFAGILLEDQLSPKACGHTRGRKVVAREEAVMRIRAAIDARNESDSDFVIIARTDARQAMSLEEALWRSRAFADVGADAIFVDALASIEEMKAFCQIAPSVPKMANMLEGGGKTPLLSPTELQDIGYKFVVYPLSLFGVSIRAMQEALTALRDGCIPSQEILPSFEDIKEIVGFNEYYEEEEQYKISEPVVGADSKEHSSDDISSQTLRLKLTENNGHEKLDARISAGFLEGMSSMISGMDTTKNVMELLKKASLEGMPEKGKLLADFYGTTGDRIQVFVE